MTTKPFDQFNKNLFRELLSPFGQVTPNMSVPGEERAIVAIEELPARPETLWLRLLGSGRTQEDAIAELLLLPQNDPKRSSALSLLVSWRISMEVMDQVDREERRILMALSQAYQEWEHMRLLWQLSREELLRRFSS